MKRTLRAIGKTLVGAGLAWALLGPLPAPVAADPMPMGAGLHPAPRDATPVAIEEERLAMDVGARDVRVTARLVLRNDGPDAALDVGFPCYRTHDEGVAGLDCRARLRVTLDGKALRVARPRGRAPESAWTWSLAIAAGARRTLEVTYTVRLVNERYGSDALAGTSLLYYRLSTGALWAGPIGRLEMEVRVPTDGLVHIAPAGYTREPGVVRWSLRDYEPDGELVLGFLVPGAARLLGFWPPPSAGTPDAKADERRARGAAVVEALRDTRSPPARLFTAVWGYARLPFLGAAPAPADVARCAEESARLIEKAVGPSE